MGRVSVDRDRELDGPAERRIDPDPYLRLPAEQIQQRSSVQGFSVIGAWIRAGASVQSMTQTAVDPGCEARSMPIVLPITTLGTTCLVVSWHQIFEAGATCPSPLPSMPRRRSEPDPVAKVFGAAVRAERERQGLTLEGLGALMGRPDGKYLGEVERGFHSPTLTMAKSIASALDITLHQLTKDL